MAVKYLSPEWLKVVQENLKEEFSTKGRLTTKFAYIIEECPDNQNKWTWLELKKGQYVEFNTGIDEPPAFDYALAGTYETFTGILKGEVNGDAAFMNGQVKLKGGSQLAAMKLVGTINRMTEVISAVDTEY